MRIDIVYDTVCPWCYVGKRRFDKALEMRPHIKPDIRYRSFLLNPDLPPEGVDRAKYLESKFGSTDSQQYEQIIESLTETGRDAGIGFEFEKMTRTPNSANSHRLVRLAQTINKEVEAVELVFASFFEEGQDIGDPKVLIDLAIRLDIDEGAASTHFSGDGDLSAVYNESARMHRLGITGVPCYIFNETRAIAGAQETEILVKMLDMVAAEGLEQPVLQSHA